MFNFSSESHREKSSARYHDKFHERYPVGKKEHKKSEEKQKVRGEENHELRARTIKEKTKEERFDKQSSVNFK